MKFSHVFTVCMVFTTYFSSAFIYQQCPIEKICVDSDYISQICIREGTAVEIKVWSSTQRYFSAKIPFAGIHPMIAEDCPKFKNLTARRPAAVYSFASYQLVERESTQEEKQLFKLTFDSLLLQDKLMRDLEKIRNKRKLHLSAFKSISA